MSDAGEDISNDMEGLKNAMKNGNDTVKTDMRQISDQFQKIMDLLFDEIEDLRNGEDQDDIFIDASDEEISRTKQGSSPTAAILGQWREIEMPGVSLGSCLSTWRQEKCHIIGLVSIFIIQKVFSIIRVYMWVFYSN